MTHKPNREYFAYDKQEERCRVFTDTICGTRGKCSRFKLPMQYRKDRESSKKRAIEAGYYVRSDKYDPTGG